MKTIFDLGLHEGWDTEFYLLKGFRVVAVEASPQFLSYVRAKFAEHLASGQLVIVNKAVAEAAGVVPFFVRTDFDGWSSIYRDAAERDGVASTAIEIEATTLGALVDEFGTPYFLKCDIEEADQIVARQLLSLPEKPSYVSFEVSAEDSPILESLTRSGYTRFQLVNQSTLSLFSPPFPAREGVHTPRIFDGKMSGLFGDELPPTHWADEALTRKRLRLWRKLTYGRTNRFSRSLLKHVGRLTRRTWLIRSGWIDVHAGR